MTLRFTVLASGSGGNASLLEANGYGLLLDAGLGPRQLAARLAEAGASWQQVHAVLLTHTHSDHWKERTLEHLVRRRVPFYCHAGHHAALRAYGTAFAALHGDDLVHGYEAGEEFSPLPGLRCLPLALPHDGGATFGFRFEAGQSLYEQRYSLGYVADLGTWTAELAQALADVDLLALEFNHDVDLEYASGRSPHLIARVLGEEGHLSNEQAAALLHDVLRRSSPGRLRHLVQLHLSRDCNRPGLAADVARAALQAAGVCVEVHTAHQYVPLRTLHVGAGTNGSLPEATPPPRRSRTARPKRQAEAFQLRLPGFEE